MVSITDHSHTVIVWGITLEIAIKSLLCKVYGNKNNDTAFLCEHVIPPPGFY